MIKKVALKASGVPAPTGYKPIRRLFAPEPRDSTRPVTGSPHSTFIADEGFTSGVHRNPPKPRPHILQGWKSAR